MNKGDTIHYNNFIDKERKECEVLAKFMFKKAHPRDIYTVLISKNNLEWEWRYRSSKCIFNP